LIVDLISSYEGAQRAASKLIVIWDFGLNELIKLISASCHQQLSVAYVNTNSKIYLIFGEECRTFCEGEWEQQVGNISLAGYTGLVGHIKLVQLSSFVGHDGFIGLIGLNGLVGRIRLPGFIGLIGINGLIGRNDLVHHIGLFGHIGLVGHIGYNGLVGFIGLSLVSFIGHGLASLAGLIGHINFISLIGYSGINGISLISLVGLSLISIIGCIGLIGLGNFGIISLVSLSALPACRIISLVDLIGLSTHQLRHCLDAAITVAAATISTVLAIQGVATAQSSATKIATTASFYDLSASLLHVHSLVRGNMMWWWLALAKKVVLVDCLFCRILPR
jgi:hypothetical protein